MKKQQAPNLPFISMPYKPRETSHFTWNSGIWHQKWAAAPTTPWKDMALLPREPREPLPLLSKRVARRNETLSPIVRCCRARDGSSAFTFLQERVFKPEDATCTTDATFRNCWRIGKRPCSQRCGSARISKDSVRTNQNVTRVDGSANRRATFSARMNTFFRFWILKERTSEWHGDDTHGLADNEIWPTWPLRTQPLETHLKGHDWRRRRGS